MQLYHKINSLFKRDEKGKFILGQWATPEIGYLNDNVWSWDEKIDGTNIRISWDGESVEIGGRTDNAQIPVFLYNKLLELFNADKMNNFFPDINANEPVCLYGEGFGAKIQKGGGNYISDGVNFCLFDILIGNFWLKKVDVDTIGLKMELEVAPEVGSGTIHEAIELISSGDFKSQWGDFLAEGLVLRPNVHLKARNGDRIITKVKFKDFKRFEVSEIAKYMRGKNDKL